MQRLTKASKKVVGLKQSQKAIVKGLAKLVYVARDAEERIRRPILEICRSCQVPIVEVDFMSELGRASGIQVGTAVVVVIEE